jgi:hypothetical protein
MVRLLCVGLGGMGHHDWNAALDSGGFVAVAGGDLQEQARQVFAAKTGAPTFADFSEALAAVQVIEPPPTEVGTWAAFARAFGHLTVIECVQTKERGRRSA